VAWKGRKLTPKDLFSAAGQNNKAPIPYKVKPSMNVALYENFLRTAPAYVNDAMGYALL